MEFVATGAGTGDGTAVTITPTNSYSSIADADQYHFNIGTPAASWDDKSDSVKEQALRDGTRYLDGHYSTVRKWKGRRTTSTNALDWPRRSVVDSDGYAVLNNELPQGLEDATAAAALRSLDATQNPTGLTPDLTKEGTISYERKKADGVGEKETHYEGGFNQYVTFTEIDELVHDLIMPVGGVIR